MVAVLALLGGWQLWARLRPGVGRADRDGDPFLRDVAEPIRIVNAMSFDDGGSRGLRFADARGVERDVCLENTLDDDHNLVLNSFLPRGERARRVPIGGPEEKALLRLLERWAAQDPDAGELERRYALYQRGALDLDGFWNGPPPRCRVKQVAMSILRELRERN